MQPVVLAPRLQRVLVQDLRQVQHVLILIGGEKLRREWVRCRIVKAAHVGVERLALPYALYSQIRIHGVPQLFRCQRRLIAVEGEFRFQHGGGIENVNIRQDTVIGVAHEVVAKARKRTLPEDPDCLVQRRVVLAVASKESIFRRQHPVHT